MVTPASLLLSLLVELKNGETYNGHLVNCDNKMNINLREVICTSRDGETFWHIPECYIRGNNIKYLRIPDEVIDMVQEEVPQKKEQKGKGSGKGKGGGAKGGGRGGDKGGKGGGGKGSGGRGGGKGEGGRGTLQFLAAGSR